MAEVIDLAFAGTAPDGAHVYASPPVAALGRLILEYPQETLQAGDFTLRLASLAVIGGLICHFAQPPRKAKKKPLTNASGRAAAGQVISNHPHFSA